MGEPLLITLPYAPRQWAERLHESFKRWLVMILHRRAGKTTAVINHHQRRRADRGRQLPLPQPVCVRHDAVAEPLEIDPQLARRLITTARVLVERLENDAVERRRQEMITRPRRRQWRLQNRGDELWSRDVAERPSTGCHLVENHSGRVDVASRISIVAAQQLGRHVGKGAVDVRPSRGGDGRRGVGLALHLGQPEVEDLQPAIKGEAEVARLQIAVNDPFGVRRLQPGRTSGWRWPKPGPSVVRLSGVPPRASTIRSGVWNPANTMRSSIPQLAPAGNPGAAAISTAAPPPDGTRFRRRSAKNPIHAPSSFRRLACRTPAGKF